MPKIRARPFKADMPDFVKNELARWYRDNCHRKIIELEVWFFTFTLSLSVLENFFEKLTDRELSCD